MKIVDKKEFKVYQFEYNSDHNAINLLNSGLANSEPQKNDQGAYYAKLSLEGNGMGDQVIYIINCLGWGPLYYNENYKDYASFEKLMHDQSDDENIRIATFFDSTWKIMENYSEGNYFANGIELRSEREIINTYRIDNAFFFYCYQKDIDQINNYDKYLIKINIKM